MGYMDKISNYTKKRENLCIENDSISKDLFREYGVNMGLRDINGNGVLTGLTNISEVSAFKIIDGKKVPSDGQLLYRGYDVKDLVQGSKGEKFIFEEAAYLLLFGKLPSNDELKQFLDIIAECMELPTNFTRDVIMKAHSIDQCFSNAGCIRVSCL